MAYVPPALRRKQQEHAKRETAKEGNSILPSNVCEASSERLPTIFDIQNHFWPKPARSVEQDSREDSDKIDQNGQYQAHSTLNGTARFPNSLQYVFLFKKANPYWDQDGIIFVKTNLHLLPSPSNVCPQVESRLQSTLQKDTGAIDVKLKAIAVFHEAEGPNARFKFLGYYQIVSLQFLEPNTEALVHMLEQKFTKVNKFGKSRQNLRDPAAWKKSLNHRWAVIKLDKDEQADKELEVPVIEATEKDPLKAKEPKKTVNELLQEMRLETK